MANRTEYEMLWKLGAQLGKDFNGTFSSARSVLSATQKEIQALNKMQAEVSGYEKQKKSIDASNQKLDMYQKQLQNVQKELSQTQGFNSELANKEVELQAKIKATEDEIAVKTGKLNQMGDALAESGIDVKNLSGESERLSEKIGELREEEEKAGKEAEKLGDKGADAFEAMQSALVASGVLTAVNKLYDEYKECISAAIEFESTMTGVAKTTDFTDAEFAAMSKEIKEMSQIIPASTKELGGIAETAGQLGIAKNDLTEFTQIMAMLGTATNMTSEEAATMLAQFASITGMSPAEYSNLGSTIVALGNSYATTEKNIAEMSQTIAAAGSIAGMTEADITAISAAVTSLGITAQNGGTQMTKLISSINSAVSSGEGLSDWADVAGVSAEEFASAWGTDAAGALDMFIKGLHEAYVNGEDVYSILGDLEISETRMVTMITSLAKSGDRLTDTLGTAQTAWKENNALSEEAEKRYGTTESKLTLLDNSYKNLQATIGELFTPELKTLAEIGADVLSGITEFTEEHPVIVKSIVAISLELATLIAAYSTISAVKKSLNAIRTISTILKAKDTVATSAETVATVAQTNATNAATAAQTAHNAALLASPVGLVMAGVGLLTVGVVAFTEATQKSAKAEEQLTLKCQKEQQQLKQLNAEYKKTVEIYGESSYEAQSAKWEIDELTKAYEEGKTTVEEYHESLQSYLEARKQEREEYQKTYAEYEKNYAGTVSLIDKLEELGASSDSLLKNQTAVSAIVEKLNGDYGSLGLTFDATTGKFSKSITELREYAKQVADTQKAETALEEYATNLSLLPSEEEAYENAKAQYEPYKEAAEKAKKDYDDYLNSFAYLMETFSQSMAISSGDPNAYNMYPQSMILLNAWNKAEKEAKNFKSGYEEAKSSYEATQKAVKEFEDTYGFKETDTIVENTDKLKKATDAVTNGFMTAEEASNYYGVSLQQVKNQVTSFTSTCELLDGATQYVRDGFLSLEEVANFVSLPEKAIETQMRIEDIIGEIDTLSKAYEEVREAAEKSIQGQYELWDTASVVVPTSIGTINTALETQLSYWDDYNTDLTNLLERTDEIDGLSEVIASFADGSKESINAIAGMANASDEELAQMVSNWKSVKEEQDKATKSLVELATGYEQQMQELKTALDTEVEGLNLEEEAAEAAKATVDAYTEAIKDSTDDAVKAAEKLSQLVATALKNPDAFVEDSSVSEEKQLKNSLRFGLDRSFLDWRMERYATGTDGALPGLALVGEQGPELVAFGGGEKVFTAKETQMLMREINRETKIINAYATGTGEDVTVISFLPSLINLMKTVQAVQSANADIVPQSNPMTAEQRQSGNVYITVSPSFTVENGNDIENIDDKIREWSDEVVEMVMDAIDEKGIDTKRGVYA